MKKLVKRLLVGLVLGAGVYACGAIYLGVGRLTHSNWSSRRG